MDEMTAVVPLRTRRRRMTALAGLLVAAGALTACGSGSGGSTGASASLTTSPSVSASPSPSASASASAAPTVSAGDGSSAAPTPGSPASPTNPGIASGEPDPNPVKLPAIGYQIQGSTLTVYFYGGTCDTYGLKVNESKPGEVDVRVVITQVAPRGKECPALAKKNAVTAQLTHPLAGRTVVDQATGQPVPLDSGPVGGPQ